jgi:integrase
MRKTSAMTMATRTPSNSANPLSAISGVVSVSPRGVPPRGDAPQDLNLLHNVLASAVREELIEINPAHRPERPKVPDHEFTWRILEPGEIANVLKSFTDERARIVFLTAILTAMRRHELVNLAWGERRLSRGGDPRPQIEVERGLPLDCHAADTL